MRVGRIISAIKAIYIPCVLMSYKGIALTDPYAALSAPVENILGVLTAVCLRPFMYFDGTYIGAKYFYSTFRLTCRLCGVAAPTDEIDSKVANKFGWNWHSVQGFVPPADTERSDGSLVADRCSIELGAWREFYQTDYPPGDDPLYFLNR